MSTAKFRKVSLKNYVTAVVDSETDPFKQGRVPKPFVIGHYWDGGYERFWGDDCVDQYFNWLRASKMSFLIYAHNGGKFDFHFFFEYLENPIVVISGRIVQAACMKEGTEPAKHFFQDSYAILPFALETYRKTKIDYKLFERHLRENNREKIEAYLYDDCRDLFDLVSDYNETFGHTITVGSNAMKQLRKLHHFERCDPKNDAHYRNYYFGGRVQCFEIGVITGPFRVVDVNSEYPAAMRDFKHPLNGNFETSDTMPDNFDYPFFIHFTGYNRGALPTRTREGITFDVEYGEFYACSHEIKTALEYGLIDIEKVHSCEVSLECGDFAEFVNHYYGLKEACKKSGDRIGELKWKYVCNSAYGKFAQNPENYFDWRIVRDYDDTLVMESEGWDVYNRFPEFEIWRKKAEFDRSAYYDVAIAASITSAARSILLRGLQNAIRPIYCDTDSLICADFKGDIDPYRLGAWKDEGTSPIVAIAGKKLYALLDRLPTQIETKRINGLVTDHRSRRDYEKCIGIKKTVSKGGNLSAVDIIAMCQGGQVDYTNPVPNFSLRSAPKFTSRRFKKTA